MRRILAVVLTAMALLGFTATQADAGRAFTGPTFQLTADATLAPYAGQVASMWSKAVGVRVEVVADCAGARCIHAVFETPACPGAQGCAFRNADGSYTAQVAPALDMWRCTSGYVDTMAHEVGHGIIGSLGGGPWHASSADDLMGAAHYPCDPVRRITRETKAYVGALL